MTMFFRDLMAVPPWEAFSATSFLSWLRPERDTRKGMALHVSRWDCPTSGGGATYRPCPRRAASGPLIPSWGFSLAELGSARLPLEQRYVRSSCLEADREGFCIRSRKTLVERGGSGLSSAEDQPGEA